MKITHLCLAGTITDGWSYQENMLAKCHRKMGYEVSIVTSRWVYNDENKLYKFPKTNYYLEDGTHVIRLEIINKDNLTYKFKKYNKVEETLNQLEPDILFIHGCQFVDVKKVANYLKKHTRTIAYVDNHADFSNSASNIMSRAILHGIIWKHCAHTILPYVSKFYGVLPARVEFLKNVYHLPSNKIELLVMGGDDEMVEAASQKIKVTRRQYGIQEEDFLIVTGGKIDKWKKQTILLMEAVKKIKRHNLRLLIFGSVDDDLKDQVHALIDGYIIQYVGWINSEYSYDLFAAANLAVFPGRHSVFWEQVAAQGIPMVVKDWYGTHHIDLGGNVIFLHNDSEKEIEEVILGVLDNPSKYLKMVECAWNKRKEFSYMDIAKRSIQQ